jgi:hypothetical protein
MLGAATAWASAPLPAETSAFNALPSPWATPYFDQALPLAVDPSWVAVRGLSGGGSHLASELDAQLVMSRLEPSNVSGWSYVPVRGGGSVEGLESLVRAIGATPGLFASPVFLGGVEQLPWVPTDELIVQIKPGHELPDLDVLEYDLGGLPGVVRVGLNASTAFEVLDQVSRVAAQDGVAWAQPNAIWWARHFYTPNDPDYSSQWALHQANDMDMDAPECWDTTFGNASIIVSILDDGIDQDHPDISQVPGNDFTDEGTGGDHTTMCDGHGSCVGGCVSATIDNNLGVTGVAPGCRVMATRIFNAIDFFGFCFGFIETTDAWIANGIGWATQNGARVTNSSWGGGSPSSVVTTAFENARAAGVIHFGAAGNDGSSSISYPASLSALNAVAAINSSGSLASFSTYGSGLFCSAPGEGILTTDWVGSDGFAAGNYATVDGTSFASPYAAGVAALVLSMDSSLSPDEVEDIMAATCKDRGAAGYDTSYGWGIVSAAAAVEAVDTEDCVGDVNGDGQVGTDDLLDAIAHWGPCSGCASDLDGDGQVGTNDILGLIAHWGPCV